LPYGVSVHLEGINDSGDIVGEYAFGNGLEADGFLLTPDPDIAAGIPFIGDIPPPPSLAALWGPIDLPLVDVLPVKEFRASPGSVPEPSTWAMMALAFAGLGAARLSRNRGAPASA
jgi:hypothetical protein